MLTLLLALAAPAHAEDADPILHWDGELELHGKPVHGKVHLKLTLWDEEEGGNPLHNERHSGGDKLKARQGELSFEMGRLASLADARILDQGAPRDVWLEVTLMQVDKNTVGDTFEPRLRVLEAEPFAFACDEPTKLEGDTYTLTLTCVPGDGRER